MLALNKELEKASKELDTQFLHIRYAPLEAISALLTQKFDAGSLISQLSN